MDATQRREIEADCRNLQLAWFRALDEGDADAGAALFAADCLWERPGATLRGPNAVKATMLDRAPGLLTRHVATNQLIDIIDADHAECRCYYLVFRHDSGASAAPLPRPFEAPDRMGDYINKFVRTAQGWKISYAGRRNIFG